MTEEYFRSFIGRKSKSSSDCVNVHLETSSIGDIQYDLIPISVGK